MGDIFVNLVSGKSWVTPLKETTILRMELSGNLFLSRLINTVYNTSKNQIQTTRRIYWSDSLVTISWIKADHNEFKVFVENWLQEIRKNYNPKDWYYSESSNNLADLLPGKRKIENFKEDILW